MLYYITNDKLHSDKIQKFLGSVLFFLSFFLSNEINTFVQQGPIKLIKSDSKDIYNVTKDFYSK